VRAGELTILDDSYNASPSSMIAALELLATLPGRHVAVLGEMRELGDAHERGHREVGEAAAARVDELLVIGEQATGIASGAASLGQAVTLVPDREAALEALRQRLRPGDSVLVKASRGAELDLLVDALVVSAGVDARTGAGGPEPEIGDAREESR
jgi:UDP-N-acetylmuramoyl-tripeptide--D-alanyl-D-alanine ligase